MAEAQTQDNQEDHDEVAEKAAQIGKDLGVEDATNDGKEKIPDYEIIEDKGDEDNAGDERIAKEREKAARSERKQLSAKEKRDLRKKRVQEKFNEKDAIINQQQAELQELKTWRGQVEGRLANVDKSKVEDALQQTQIAYQKAEADHAAAFTEGDGVKLTLAMRAMYEAQKRSEQLQALKQQYEKLPAQHQSQNNAPDPVLVSKAKAWAEKNRDWYNPAGGDEDSEIARAVSQTLANEGFDPRTDDYWEELSDRLASRGVGGEYEEEEPAPRQRRRTSPPVSGGSNRGDVAGKQTIKLPTAFINTLKDNGYWEDLPKRNSLIKRYLNGVKQNQTQQ